MSKQVQVSQKVLFSLAGMLIVSLVAVGFLLGRQSKETAAGLSLLTPSPLPIATPISLVGQADQSLDARVNALQGRVGALPPKTIRQPQSVALSQVERQSTAGGNAQAKDSLNSIDLEARRVYFKQLDAVLGTSALANPQPFATRLLEQGMSGDDGRLDSVLAHTSQAASAIEAVEPPPACLEHKTLVLAQLSRAVILLKQVQTATRAGDAEKLKALPLPDDQMMSETLRLHELDRSLRP